MKLESFDFQLSEGEIHFLWWFIQGGFMEPETRRKLRRAWGFCERHAWGFICVEATFRHGWMHGPAILYADLMQRALAAFNLRGPFQSLQLVKNLRKKGPCLMCELGFGTGSKGRASPELITRGRDTSELRAFAQKTERSWQHFICGRCAGNDSAHRCREHLIEDLRRGAVKDLAVHRLHIMEIVSRVTVYERSFRFEFRGTETEEDMAALIGAVGWCSGWRALFSLLG